MKIADCPRCGQTARPAGLRAYCPACGWNRGFAESELPLELKVRGWLFVAAIVLGLLAWFFWKAVIWSFFLILMAAFAAYEYARFRYHLRTLLAARVDSGGKGYEPGPGVERLESPAIPQTYRFLLDLPRPRRLRMKRSFRVGFQFVWVVLVIFAWIGFSLVLPPDNHPDDPLDGSYILAFDGAAFLLMVWSWLRQRRRAALLVNGELCFARVVISEAEQGAISPLILYQQQLPTGQVVEGVATDHTESFHTEMRVPVFYDAADPSKNLAMCGSIYDVIAPRQRRG